MSRLSRLTAELPSFAVLLVAAVGVAITATRHWRRGVIVIGTALLLGALLRAALPSARAGLLAVRRRPIDVAVLAAFGTALVALASSVPTAR